MLECFKHCPSSKTNKSMQKFILITVIDADYYFDAGILYSVDSFLYQTYMHNVL